MSKPPRTPPAVAQYEADLADLMSRPQFHRFIWTVLEKAGIFHADYRADIGATNHALGRRSLGLDILNDLDRVTDDAALLWLMQSEQMRRNSQPKEPDVAPEDV